MTTTTDRDLTPFEIARLEQLRAQHAGTRDVEALIAEFKAEMLAGPVPPACPGWCELDAGHTYDSITDDGTVHIRFHEHGTGDGAAVCQEERWYPDGHVETSAPYITTDTENIEMDAERAVSAGTALIEAAAQLREIEGAA